MLTMRLLIVLLTILIPQVCGASPPGQTFIYGVTIHLIGGEKLNGYIETELSLNNCNENKGNNASWKYFLERQREYSSEGTNNGSVRFINKLIPIKTNKRFSPYAAKSSIKMVKIKNIKSIEGVGKDWDGYPTMDGITIISDHMADYISNHNLIAEYIYDEDALSQQGKMEEDCGLCACTTTYLSYNPKYSKSRLIKLRKKIDKMSHHNLDKEYLMRFTECWD